MIRITAVIFDMFNTLVEDGESFWISSFQRIVTEQHLGVDAGELRKEWSSGDRQFRERRTTNRVPFQTYCDAWLRSFERTFSGLHLNGDPADAVRIVLEDMAQRPIHTDTLPALEMLQGKCRIAVLSNADDRFLNPVVQRLGVPFEAVLSSEGARCYKPRPELFHSMLSRMELTPQETVYVGDRQYEDVQGASKAGMVTVWLNRDRASPDPELSEPDHCIGSLLEIPALVDH
jgi:2-haloalkanoic acid dehalogenase type II